MEPSRQVLCDHVADARGSFGTLARREDGGFRNMDTQQHAGRFTLWAVLGIAATVATTVAGGTWLVSRTYLQDELEQYRRSVEWRLPENLRQLGEVSKKLNVTMDERKELEALRAQAQALHDQTASLQSKLKAAEGSVAMLTKRVGELEGDTFEVQKGEARFIVPGRLAIGVNYTSTISNTADIQFGKESVSAKPGTPFEATIENIRYTITLLKIGDSSCTFAVSKRPAPR
jgi:hypothetical protein